mgnify:CR=1 FL=1
MKRGKVTALVMAFIMAVSVLASPVTMLNTNAAVKAKKITMAKKATLEVGAKKKLKVTVKPAKAKVKITFRMILSILVDTFISKISLTMQPGPKIDSISGA